MPLPFGIKPPSRGTVIFTSIVGTVGGTYFASKYYAQQSRQALCDKVSWLADRPCGVHERPRKVQVFLTAPPGDGLEKSRNWFGDYVKPVLVAAAIDYEVKEARTAGQIEKVVRDQVIERRKNEQQQQQQQPLHSTPTTEVTSRPNPFAPAMQEVLQQNAATVDDFDGVIAIGRHAWREVVNGLNQGCTVSLRQVALDEAEAERQKKLDEEKQQQQQQQQNSTDETTINGTESSSLDEPAPISEQVLIDTPTATDEQQQQQQNGLPMDDTPVDNSFTYTDERDGFGVPAKLSPITYVPHENIIGWTNIPYRIYMWLVDYQRIDRFGEYVVAVALNKTRPLAVEDLDVGLQEKKYWIGDDEAKTARDQDQTIQMDDRVRMELKTYTN